MSKLVSESDLSASLLTVGPVGRIGDTSGARRDSPFGKHRVASPKAFVAPEVQPPPVTTLPPLAREERTASEAATASSGSLEAPRPARNAQRPATFDYVTLPVTAEIRSQATLLAAELQRQRVVRGRERLSANVIFRVAIQSFLERFSVEKLASVSTEKELLKLVRASK